MFILEEVQVHVQNPFRVLQSLFCRQANVLAIPTTQTLMSPSRKWKWTPCVEGNTLYPKCTNPASSRLLSIYVNLNVQVLEHFLLQKSPIHQNSTPP